MMTFIIFHVLYFLPANKIPQKNDHQPEMCEFELLEFVFESVHIDLQYDEISFSFTAGSKCLCGVCSPWSVCEVVMVTYDVGVVVAVTVIVLHVCMLREC